MEDRRLAMPGLREQVIEVICEEWPKGEDREAELNAATIAERLQKAGVVASETEVQLELSHLVDQGHIDLAADRPDMPVGRVSADLCP